MPKPNNFLDNFQKGHSELVQLITNFKDSIEISDLGKARDTLQKIDILANAHFDFEENYLYPRLRRLVLEITENLRREQQTIKAFISKSKSFLGKNDLKKEGLSDILDMLPRLSKLFNDCDSLTLLAEKFNQADKDDLNKRFNDCRVSKNLVAV